MSVVYAVVKQLTGMHKNLMIKGCDDFNGPVLGVCLMVRLRRGVPYCMQVAGPVQWSAPILQVFLQHDVDDPVAEGGRASVCRGHS